MKLKTIILIFYVLYLGACSSKNEIIQLPGRPLVFQLKKSDEPGIFATYKDSKITTAQIKDNSPVEADFKNQQSLTRLESILKKYVADPKAPQLPLEIYMPQPKQSLAELVKSFGIVMPPHVQITFKAQAPAQDIIAQWGDRQVKASELDGASGRLALIKVRSYREDLNRLSGIIIRRELLAAAQAEKLEIEAYLQKNVPTDPSSLSDAQFAEFLAAKNIKKDDISADQEKSLRNIAVEERKSSKVEEFVAKELIKGPILVHEFPPKFNVEVPEGWSALWGVKDAPVSILYFGDLVCGPCRDALKNVLQAADSYKGHINVGFNFLLSSNDRESRMISEAALCVQAQGTKKFRKFAEIYATNPPGVTEADMEKAASDAGASIEKYKKCFLSREFQTLLNQHIDFSNRVGITSQPTVLVNGEPLAGAITDQDLRDLIERKIQAESSTIGALWRRLKSVFN